MKHEVLPKAVGVQKGCSHYESFVFTGRRGVGVGRRLGAGAGGGGGGGEGGGET